MKVRTVEQLEVELNAMQATLAGLFSSGITSRESELECELHSALAAAERLKAERDTILAQVDALRAQLSGAEARDLAMQAQVAAKDDKVKELRGEVRLAWEECEQFHKAFHHQWLNSRARKVSEETL